MNKDFPKRKNRKKEKNIKKRILSCKNSVKFLMIIKKPKRYKKIKETSTNTLYPFTNFTKMKSSRKHLSTEIHPRTPSYWCFWHLILKKI